MNAMKDSLAKVTDWLHYLTEFGMTLILAFVLIDVLFPNATGVVANIGNIVAQFSKEGLTGLIALLLFLVLFKNKAAK